MQDGSTEIMAGLFFLVFPLLIREPGLAGIFVMFYVLFFPQFIEVVRKKYVYPRIGYVKLREEEPLKLTAGYVVTVFLLVAAGIVLVYAISIDFIILDMIYR